MTQTHNIDYRVYYEDTDAMGIMYHANYVSFCERGRSEMLRDIGYSPSTLIEKLDMHFVIRHMDANYLKMVQLDDLLSVQTRVKSMKNTSFVMNQVISCQNSAVFTMDITIVCVGTTGKPVRIPDVLREKFQDYYNEKDQ